MTTEPNPAASPEDQVDELLAQAESLLEEDDDDDEL